ncbi:1-aminocyclopropane-1-carboxylate deaminase [Marinitenerispora sediminis]|uniref:1-aminocyclopropane-1-carboxylate deaminase n=2 Tax=Marinitenerispora sediminis TaxID=1931232 RepID=A0A368T460_9ACTN|nr:1-aminocyclopropane-1-carboxylate deaminase [Marinitenerispora sediminis]RCV50263.1 1-aminocyclopropane-1-carboxylate deaminase [Marinitenerispora sediminis]RCV50472.1 1-aminocyclopropane-1-carboxylate deaminase [Marinitenerispora sediminis]RCV52844.1 1-aminocyclopropane-1-carboxylate deaminase [Marinitenerispora sediminis]
MSLDSFARFPLLFGPSPVHRLDRLGDHLGHPGIWAKREDVNSGLAFGGNKTRKLEYLVADALAQGADTLVSIGGVQSNHTRQVAAAAARAGLRAVLVQESWVDWPDSVYDRVGNIQLSRILGADVRLVRAGFGIGVKESWEQALDEVVAAGGTPYAIPAGASDHRLGGLGFAAWVRELERQEAELGVFFDTIVVCSVTGSTQGGMIAGAALGGRPRRIIGIDASATPAETRGQVARIARRTADLVGVGREITDAEIVLDERYHAGTYGIPDAATIDAIHTAARLEGMITDPVYEGKSMAALIDLVRRGEIGPDSTVLYAHLGGQPAVNGYSAVVGA